MPVFNIAGKNILFIHVPKTGGTTIEKVFASLGSMALHNKTAGFYLKLRDGLLPRHVPLQHLHAAALRQIYDARQFDLVFTIVRDPVNRMVSEYRHSRALLRPDALLPFSSWLRLSLAIARHNASFRNNHFRPQAEFVLERTRVLHFEDGLLQCANQVASELGLAPFKELPVEKKSIKYAAVPSRADEALIKEFYAADYRMFGRYQKERQ